MKDLFTSLIKAQSEFEKQTKDASCYGYKYLELSELIASVTPVLKKNGLGVTQLLTNDDQGRPAVRTMLFHGDTGQLLEDTVACDIVDMKQCNTAQGAGASFSYLRRYALQAILGLAAEDNDASSKPKVTPKKAVQNVKDAFPGTEEIEPETKTEPKKKLF